MLRTVYLVLRNEFRLLLQDRTALFMLFLAPVVIIAVAGFSLGNMFGVQSSARTFSIPLVDHDHGAIAKAISDGLSREETLRLVTVADDRAARAIVTRNDESPLAIVIPAGVTSAFESGRSAHILIYVDPVKRVEAEGIELRLNALSRGVAARARELAQARLNQTDADVRARVDRLVEQIDALQAQAADYQRRMRRGRATLQETLDARIRGEIQRIGARTEAAVQRATAARAATVQEQLSRKQSAMTAVVAYLRQLQVSRRAFEQWLAALKSAAGSHANEIPPPPNWPNPPRAEQLTELSRPIDLAPGRLDLTAPAELTNFAIAIPDLPMPPAPRVSLDPRSLLPARPPALPGDLDWRERPLTPGYAEVNSFDQYVPGFGITFLLLDVLWGVSVGLIDERDWGTLQRLRVSGAPVPGLMIGKLAARVLIGFVQLVVLFSLGRLLFGIELGRNPLMLLLPTAAIAFAAASFGLVIAGIARTRDSVLPIGSVAAMTMSAVGGCWWPLNFEPGWMRSVAAGMPTTWTMRAYNDLMIRGLDPTHALWPSAITLALGVAFLGAGVIGAARVYQ